MNKEKFYVKWKVDDGYAGGSRPHGFNINADDLDEYATKESLSGFFWQCIQDEFTQTINPISDCEDDFIEWAENIIAQRKATK